MLTACLKEVVRARDHVVVDALLLALVVDGHVSQNAKAKLCDFPVHLFESIFCVSVVKQFRELLDRVFAKKRLDTHIAKGQIHESLKQVDQVLGVLLGDALLV